MKEHMSVVIHLNGSGVINKNEHQPLDRAVNEGWEIFDTKPIDGYHGTRAFIFFLRRER